VNGYRIELFRESGLKRWRWRRIADNGQTVETPGQGFATKWNAKRSARRAHPDDPITTVP
jgi:hypothetical protein